uniref:Uncharacterized protein n=1 Tax=Fagus sylvatica TaxID=28930 RepID=A0A2N9EGF7_FAGSY
MASDAMDHPIHVLCDCMQGWDLGSKFSAAQDISSSCCSCELPDCDQALCCLFLYSL